MTPRLDTPRRSGVYSGHSGEAHRGSRRLQAGGPDARAVRDDAPKGVFGPFSFLLPPERMSERPGVHPHDRHPALCYHDCPACGQRIAEPFLRGGAPVAYIHHGRRRGPSCRVLIRPGVGGSVVGDETLESALLRESERAA